MVFPMISNPFWRPLTLIAVASHANNVNNVNNVITRKSVPNVKNSVDVMLELVLC
jgi:hypothetical protein